MNNLREARFRARKPQVQLWLETGIHYSTISRIECGYIKPTEQQKKRLARAVEVEVDWLFPCAHDEDKRTEEDCDGK